MKQILLLIIRGYQNLSRQCFRHLVDIIQLVLIIASKPSNDLVP